MKTPLQLLFEEVGVDADSDRALYYLDLEKEAIQQAWDDGRHNHIEAMESLDYYINTYGPKED